MNPAADPEGTTASQLSLLLSFPTYPVNYSYNIQYLKRLFMLFFRTYQKVAGSEFQILALDLQQTY